MKAIKKHLAKLIRNRRCQKYAFVPGFILNLIFFSITTLYSQEPDLGTEAQREAGKKIYNEKCAQCHGVKGDGNGVAKEFYKPQPRDFTSATFKFRTTASGELPTDEDIKRSIKQGMPYTGMPAWPKLSDEELTNLVYLIKTFADDFAGPYGVVTPLEMPKPPSINKESIKRGRMVYNENQCSDCHGNSGRGDGKSVATLKDSWEEHIRPADMTKRWTYRGGSTREDIYRTFTTGLDGSPMPSYSIEPPEDQWHLVNYVYSLSRDKPDYATAVFAKGIQSSIDITAGESLFQNSESALFPVVGQVIEPGREFYPGVNAIEVSAVFNTDEIAILLSWNDITAETDGSNNPTIRINPKSEESVEDTTIKYSDAVAIQIPSKAIQGSAKPYFMFGDKKNPVDIWFANLAENSAEMYMGKGSNNIQKNNEEIQIATNYNEGQWNVIFKRSRTVENRLSFEEGIFIPISFSIWDGFNRERGNKRGITSWYYIYLEPFQQTSAMVPISKYGFITLLLELVLIFFVRRKYKNENK